jgi:hypothetical protein
LSRAEAIGRALDRTGVELPRGLLLPDGVTLSAAPESDETRRALAAAACELWSHVSAPIGAALERAAQSADGPLRSDIDIALACVDDQDAANPLAAQVSSRAARELGAALDRTDRRLESLGDDPSGADLAEAAGSIAVDLIDLDADDLVDDIAEFVAADETDDALMELARATGDEEIRAYLREVLNALAIPGRESPVARIRELAHDALPEDPAMDLLWVSAIRALAQEAIELASVMDATESG